MGLGTRYLLLIVDDISARPARRFNEQLPDKACTANSADFTVPARRMSRDSSSSAFR